jgi:serine/threonine protein kinase
MNGLQIQRVADIEEEIRLEQEIASTIYGSIYKAVIISSGDIVAAKISNKVDPCFENSTMKAFDSIESEIQIYRLIRDFSGVVKPFAVYEDSSRICLALEFAFEGDLFEFIKRRKIISEIQVGEIFLKIVRSLRSLHKQGIAHLDVSLENLLICGNANDIQVKWCDLGVAREIKNSGLLIDKPEIGFRPGKAKYMAPEVASCHIENGILADLFSLGVVLFAMLYGFHPFDFPNDQDLAFSKIVNYNFEGILDLYHIRGEVSWEAEDLLSELLCPEDMRITSTDDILHHPWMIKNFDL